MEYPFKKCKSCEYCEKIVYGEVKRWRYYCMLDHDLNGRPVNAMDAACEKYLEDDYEHTV